MLHVKHAKVGIWQIHQTYVSSLITARLYLIARHVQLPLAALLAQQAINSKTSLPVLRCVETACDLPSSNAMIIMWIVMMVAAALARSNQHIFVLEVLVINQYVQLVHNIVLTALAWLLAHYAKPFINGIVVIKAVYPIVHM